MGDETNNGGQKPKKAVPKKPVTAIARVPNGDLFAAPQMNTEDVAFETGRSVGRAEGREEAMSVDDTALFNRLVAFGMEASRLIRLINLRQAATGRLTKETHALVLEFHHFRVICDGTPAGPFDSLTAYLYALYPDSRVTSK